MVEGKVSIANWTGKVEGESCHHEVDTNALPEWTPRVGKIWRCKLCGAKVYNTVVAGHQLGKRVRVSKKERRRQKALDQSLKEVSDTMLYGQPLDKKGMFPKKGMSEQV
jgi:hypothetical protein